MKNHELREFINELTATANKYKDCQCLREGIAKVVKRNLNIGKHYTTQLCTEHEGVALLETVKNATTHNTPHDPHGD